MRFLWSATALSLSLGLCSTAFAQEDLQIVVTATRTPTPVFRLPAEVDVIDVENAHPGATLADALIEAPGLGVVSSGGAGQQTSLFAGGANSNHTLVLFDGLRLNDPSTPGSSFDAGQDLLAGLTRIEVVQGPMSAVYGSDAIGGVMNMIPRHGGDGPLNAQLDFSAGSFGTVAGGASVDGTLGAFRYALSGEGFATDGFDLVPERMSTHTGEDDGASITTVTGVFDYAFSEAFSLDLLVRQRRAQADFDAFPFDFSTFQEYRAEDDNLQISKNDLSLGRLGATWAINPSLSLRATYGGMHHQRVQNDDGADTDLFKGDRRFGDVTLTWTQSENLSVVAGVSAENEEVDIAQGFGFPPPSNFLAESADHLGGFVTAQATFDRLTLTGAGRIDNYDSFGAHATWRGGASFALTEGARLYGAYGTSFRAPTLYERFVSFGDPDLEPEQAKSWEFGADAYFAAFGQARGIELRALYRHTAIDDLIDFGPSFTYANVDRAEIDTAEARFGVRPFEWLKARVAYVYTDARDEVAGTPLLRRPQDYWTADITLTHGAFNASLAWRSVGERTDQIYGDDGFLTGPGAAPAYAVTRASLGYELSPSAELFLRADNIFDETYEPANAFAGAPANLSFGVRVSH